MPSGRYSGESPNCGYEYNVGGNIGTKENCWAWCDTKSANYCVHWTAIDYCAHYSLPCSFSVSSGTEPRNIYKKQTPIDCSTSLVDASFPNPPSIPYDSGGSPVTITADFNVIFSGYDNTNTDCVLNSCSLRKPGCTTLLAA